MAHNKMQPFLELFSKENQSGRPLVGVYRGIVSLQIFKEGFLYYIGYMS